MAENTKCPICGEPTSIWYGNARKDKLCRHHAQMLKDGELALCEDCNQWYEVKEGCKCKKEEINNEEMKRELRIGRCLTCDNTTQDDYLFCPECFHKYKNKYILLGVSNCRTITLKDESYEGILECDDGHIVKSMAEQNIDNYLNEKDIKHFYEVPYDIGNGKKPIKPDFFLPNYLGENKNVIIEYWGFNESHKEYTERKKYKLAIYKEKKQTVVCLSAKNDLRNLNYSLKTKLNPNNIKENEINFEE